MPSADEFLRTLALVLCAAAVVTVVFQKLGQPVVLGYLLAGVAVGPHVPIPVFAHEATVHTLSELGVILLMFALGLEFSLRKLARVGVAAAVVAVVESSAMIWVGYAAARALGWSPRESLYAGAVVAISSTTIIVKAFAERGIKRPATQLVYGVLVVEDLVAVVLLALLTGISSGARVTVAGLATTVARLAIFLLVFIFLALVVVPRVMRIVVNLHRSETVVVTAIGTCFASALLAKTFGYSVVLGAFISGSVIAESGLEKRIERLIVPLRDLFGAVFFVSVGMLIDPGIALRSWKEIGLFTAIVVVGKISFVSFSAFFTGCGTRTALETGMSLAQIGEFSFIIAGLGLASGATRPALYPIAVAVSAVTTLFTPWLISASAPLASRLDARLPRSIQTFATLYGAWIEAVRGSRASAGRSRIRVTVRRLLIDAGVFAAILIGVGVARQDRAGAIARRFGMTEGLAGASIILAGGLLALPFVVGMFRSARQLGARLANEAFPSAAAGRLDLAAAPRRTLIVALKFAIGLAVGIPLVAITQPFLGSAEGAIVLGIMLLLLGGAFWRSTRDLQGHVRAGAEIVLAALVEKSRSTEDDEHALAPIYEALPGLGTPTPFRVEPAHYCVGKTLAQLNVRGATGAAVLAIHRTTGEVLEPSGKETLVPGDLLALAGTSDAIDSAKELLASGPA